MKTVIIGSGNMAWHMALAFKNAGIEVVQLFGRNHDKLQEISNLTGIPFSVSDLEKADFYLIASSDAAIESISQSLPVSALIAHTSGAMPVSSIKGSLRKASFYPLQTFTKRRNLNYNQIPFFITTSQEEDRNMLRDLALKISNRVSFISDEQRKYIHLAAVFANNFVNHLYVQAEKLCEAHDIPFDYLVPLIQETATKAEILDPKNAQTGPAVRNDTQTIHSHEALIQDPNTLNIYKTITDSITQMYEL